MKFYLKKRNIFLFISFFILTVSGSTWAVSQNLDRMLEYISYAILLTDISLNYLTSKVIENKWKKIKIFFFVTLLLSFGLCVQRMPFGKLFPLLMTMLAISISSLLSESYLNSYDRIKIASNAVLWGNIVSFIISIILGYSVLQWHSEISTYAFRGGIYIKNFFGADMLIVFIGNYLAERKIPKMSQKIIIIISVMLLLFSNSRGALIMLIVFLISIQVNIVRQITKSQRKLFVITLIFFCIVAFIILFQEVALNSFNYMMRIKGFQNYIHHPDTDFIRLLVGNAKELYISDIDYVTQFNRLYGWNGSVEFALLDILIKNGIIGLVGYVIVFYIFICAFVKSKNWEYKSFGIAVIVMILISSFVETYIQTIHSPVGIYCYLVIGGLVGMCAKENAGNKLGKCI